MTTAEYFERMFDKAARERDSYRDSASVHLIAAKALLRENERLREEVQTLSEDNEILERRLAHGGQADQESGDGVSPDER